MSTAQITLEGSTSVFDLQCDVHVPENIAGGVFRKGTALPSYDDKRRFARFYVGSAESRIGVRYLGSIPSLDRDTQWRAGIPIDVSRGGLQFLNDQEVFPGERIRFAVDKEDELKLLDGEVAWCRRVAPRCYRVGIRFLQDA